MEKLILQNERGLRRSEGSGMLIDDPLIEGSKASYTDSKLWRTEHSFLRMRGNSDAHKGAACSKVTLCGEGSSASSTHEELWRAEKPFLRMRGNSDAHKGTACSKMTLLVRGATLALTDSELWRAEDSFLR